MVSLLLVACSISTLLLGLEVLSSSCRLELELVLLCSLCCLFVVVVFVSLVGVVVTRVVVVVALSGEVTVVVSESEYICGFISGFRTKLLQNGVLQQQPNCPSSLEIFFEYSLEIFAIGKQILFVVSFLACRLSASSWHIC